MSDYKEILKEALAEASDLYQRKTRPPLDSAVCGMVDRLVSDAEKRKAVVTVLITLLCHKLHTPEDDIRYHQKEIGNFSGRTIDSRYVTPFMKDNGFPAMAESGWLTRSLEQKAPYTLDYPGAIKPAALKHAFLGIIDYVQCRGADARVILTDILYNLIQQRDSHNISLAKPHGLAIDTIIQVLHRHFDYSYSGQGASRLPVIALYAAYQCLMPQLRRFEGKILCPLESHTSADSQSGQIGDIQVNTSDNVAFEGVEVKHNIQITPELVEHAYSKLMVHPTERYYILTTARMDVADREGIVKIVNKIRNQHGCQMIVNGVYSSLRYYLRLLEDPAEFIDKYVELMKLDNEVRYPQQKAWNEIIGQI